MHLHHRAEWLRKVHAVPDPSWAGNAVRGALPSGRGRNHGSEAEGQALCHEFPQKGRICFQNSEIQLFTSSVEEEIAFGLRQLHLPEEEIRKRTEEFLERFGLTKLRKRAPWSISGGEKKRTALAAVFAMEPEVLVIDEPISGLDEDAQEWVTEFLKEIRRENRTIIIGTHDKRLLAGLADAELHMNRYHRVEFTSVY